MPTSSQSPSLLLLTAPHIGQLLKAARKRQRLTQADVAARIAISQNRLSFLENHPDAISVKQLLSWCSVLGLDLRLGERPKDEPNDELKW